MKSSPCASVAARAREILEEVSLAVVPGRFHRRNRQARRAPDQRPGRTQPFLNYADSPATSASRSTTRSSTVSVVRAASSTADIVKLDIASSSTAGSGTPPRPFPSGCPGSGHPAPRQNAGSAGDRHRSGPGRQPRPQHLRSHRKFVVSNGYSVVREFVATASGRALHEEPHSPIMAARSRPSSSRA